MTGFTFTSMVVTDSVEQTLEAQMTGYFRVYDTVAADSGWYTTLSVSDLVGPSDSIDANNIFIKGTGIDLLTGTANPRIELDAGFASYQNFVTPITYIKRDTAANSDVR